MRIIWLLSCASLVSAAIYPFNGLMQQRDATDLKTVELSPSIDTTVLNNNGYRYNAVRRDVSEIAKEYLPPNAETAAESSGDGSLEEPQESTILGDNGYEYKTVRHFKYRQRRDVSEIVNEYLPPAEETAKEEIAEIKSEDDLQEPVVLGESGYEYRTVRHLKYRRRRDVFETSNDYLPPAEENATEIVAEIKSEEEPQESVILGDSGYEYKTVRRLKYRQRRDVSEIANKYLPPAENTATEVFAEIKSEEEPQESAVLGEGGYEYKSVRRLKYPHFRDISEIANEYLPPAEETATEIVAENKPEEEPQDVSVLGDSGYEYKTVRRLKHRHLRDVSEIANKYLPPIDDIGEEVVSEIKSEEEPQESVILGDSGYEYKSVSRLKSRQRQDASDISTEYLPPVEKTATEVVNKINSEEEAQESSVLGEGGVSEISNDYLPPAEETATEVVNEIKSEAEPQETAVLGESGYEYKTVRRLIHRQRRDVSEIANEYLPPAEDTATEVIAEMESEEEPQESVVLGDSGYEYKTVRRLKYRQRREVSETANHYLPPAKEATTYVVAEIKDVGDPHESAVLGDNGYEYKTVRRLKYRHRRDVSATVKDYLPLTEELSKSEVEP